MWFLLKINGLDMNNLWYKEFTDSGWMLITSLSGVESIRKIDQYGNACVVFNDARYTIHSFDHDKTKSATAMNVAEAVKIVENITVHFFDDWSWIFERPNGIPLDELLINKNANIDSILTTLLCDKKITLENGLVKIWPDAR